MVKRRLILIKHAKPEIRPDQPSSLWTLSTSGRASCVTLAEELTSHDPSVIVSSTEPKARETAEILGKRLSLSVETVPGLQEHDRTGVPFLDNPTRWETLIEQFFAEPNNLIFGRETAIAARDRFSSALDAVLEEHPTGDLAVVSHGTVMSLFIGMHTGTDPLSLWRILGLPSLVVVQLPSFDVVRLVETIPTTTTRRDRSVSVNTEEAP